jgi:hypothetical protein
MKGAHLDSVIAKYPLLSRTDTVAGVRIVGRKLVCPSMLLSPRPQSYPASRSENRAFDLQL